VRLSGISLVQQLCIVSYLILILFCNVLNVLSVTKFFKQYLLMLAISQMATSLITLPIHRRGNKEHGCCKCLCIIHVANFYGIGRIHSSKRLILLKYWTFSYGSILDFRNF
jgi:hypothetical protein